MITDLAIVCLRTVRYRLTGEDHLNLCGRLVIELSSQNCEG